MADRAAPLMFDNASAFRAGASILRGGLGVDVIAVVYQMVLDSLGNGIGAGKHAVSAKAGRAVAGDPQKLFNYLTGLDAAAPGERYHAADRLALGGGASAGLAHRGEKLEQAGIILVDRYVERAAPGLHLMSASLERLGTLPFYGLLIHFDRHGGNCSFPFFFTGREYLFVSRSVPIDGDALAAGFVGKHVYFFNVLDGGGI